jgi:hypothetical protein
MNVCLPGPCSGLVLCILFGAALAAGPGSKTDSQRGKCWITFPKPCPHSPDYKGRRDDSPYAYNSLHVGTNADRCLDRAQSYFEWCGYESFALQVTATYQPTGQSLTFPPDDVAAEARQEEQGKEAFAGPSSGGAAGETTCTAEGVCGAAERAGGAGAAGRGPEQQLPSAFGQAAQIAWQGASHAASLAGTALGEGARLIAPLADFAGARVQRWVLGAHGDGRSWPAVTAGILVVVLSFGGKSSLLARAYRRARAQFVRRIDWGAPERARVLKDPQDFRRSVLPAGWWRFAQWRCNP